MELELTDAENDFLCRLAVARSGEYTVDRLVRVTGSGLGDQAISRLMKRLAHGGLMTFGRRVRRKNKLSERTWEIIGEPRGVEITIRGAPAMGKSLLARYLAGVISAAGHKVFCEEGLSGELPKVGDESNGRVIGPITVKIITCNWEGEN